MSPLTNNWRPIVAHLLTFLESRGFTLAECDDGEEGKKQPSRAEALDILTRCDEGNTWFQCGDDPKPLWARLILGNAPSELVQDYTSRETRDGKAFDQAMMDWSDAWEEQGVPVGTREIPPFLLGAVQLLEALVAQCHTALPANHTLVVDAKRYLSALANDVKATPPRDPQGREWPQVIWTNGEEGK